MLRVKPSAPFKKFEFARHLERIKSATGCCSAATWCASPVLVQLRKDRPEGLSDRGRPRRRGPDHERGPVRRHLSRLDPAHARLHGGHGAHFREKILSGTQAGSHGNHQNRIGGGACHPPANFRGRARRFRQNLSRADLSSRRTEIRATGGILFRFAPERHPRNAFPTAASHPDAAGLLPPRPGARRGG